jgi:glycosyl transferase family 1
MANTIRARVRGTPVVAEAWAAWKRRRLHRDYAAKADWYAGRAPVAYREEDVVADVRRRLAARRPPPKRRVGEIHTFAFIPRIGWHGTLYNDLAELGPVTEFDYVALGYRWQEFHRGDRRGVDRRREMNARALAALRAAHRERPVDWVFVYASGLEIQTEWIQAIVDELALPTVNMCLDDKQSWTGSRVGGQRRGQVDIARAFDLSWTSATVACQWYLAEAARPLYMPEGFDLKTCSPMAVVADIPVSFVGGAYGFRRSVVRYLRRHQVPVRAFGPGWEEGWVEKPAEIFNRSLINLGMGGIGYSETLTNVKGRDFEIPATGGGMYLTSFNADLAHHLLVGQEVVCYGSREELVDLARYYLARPGEAKAIAARARARCLAEHRWRHRYEKICRILQILPETPGAAA